MEIGNNAREKLRSLVERIERLDGEKTAIGTDIKEVYAEAKGVGFDVKVLRKVIARRKKGVNEEEDALIETYWSIVGLEVLS